MATCENIPAGNPRYAVEFADFLRQRLEELEALEKSGLSKKEIISQGLDGLFEQMGATPTEPKA